MITHIIVYLLSFVGIWIGSGLAIRSVERISTKLRVSSFALSFIVLGFFTSVSELSVGVNSIIQNDPEIYVGNLIGASIVLFMLIIPLLAVVGNSIRISPEFRGFNLPASLVVIALPVILVMDGKIGRIDSLACVSLFGILLISIEAKRGLIAGLKMAGKSSRHVFRDEVMKIIFGMAIIFIASRFVVEQTLYFAEILKISPFIISLLLISIGTNVPELSLVLRSLFTRNHQVAFGDYVGSAAFNTFLLGALTLAYGKTVYLENKYTVSLVFLIFGLTMFYIFSRSKNSFSRVEGLVLFSLYMVFVAVETFF